MADSFFAVRGGRSLSEAEFRSHIALAIRLENVGALLGAGASADLGGKLMAQVWEEFGNSSPNSATWFIGNGFAPSDGVNLEALLDRVEIAWEENQRTGDQTFGSQLAEHRHKLRKTVLRAGLLKAEWWANPGPAVDEEFFNAHRRFISRLIGNRQPGQAAPWLFTTNYDLAIEWTSERLGVHCASGFSGVHSRTFNPASFDLGFRNVHAKGEARFGAYNIYLGKLHGSLSWLEDEDGGVIERPSPSVLQEIQRFLKSEEPSDWPGFLVFPGAAKFVHTTGFVYSEIIRRFTEFLTKPNSCLIIAGYSFCDEHINRLIITGLQNPTLQIIIYLPELDRLGIYPTLAATGPNIAPNPLLRRLLASQYAQVTVCGFGERAHFKSLTEDLPEPALVDEAAERARELARLLTQSAPVVPVAAAAPQPEQVIAPGSSENG